MRKPLRLAACTTLCLAWATSLAGVEVTLVDRAFQRAAGAPEKVEIPFTATAGPATIFLAAKVGEGYESILQNIVLIELNGERLLPLIRIDRDTIQLLSE